MIRRGMVLGGTVAPAMLALAVGLVATASSDVDQRAEASKSKFKPKKVAGNWRGEWVNHTFDTDGPATMKLRVKGKGKKQKFIGTFDLGGNAFGCPNPAPRKVTMKKGKGPNSWNSKGFKANWENAQGPAELTFKQKGMKFTGAGLSPCTPDIAYSYSGKMTTKKVRAAVDITLDDEPFANSSLTMKKK